MIGQLYKAVEIKDGESTEPVQYVGVYCLHWMKEWGPPFMGFVEVDTPEEPVSNIVDNSDNKPPPSGVPFKGFWERLKAFVINVEVQDCPGEEEKNMILNVCETAHQPSVSEDVAISALRNIVSPILYLEDIAEKDGAKLDGYMAVQLIKNANFYQGIAKKALDQIQSLNVQHK